MTSEPLVVIPGDEPPQIADSPHLSRLSRVARILLFDTRPSGVADQVARCQQAEILINSRGSVRWDGTTLCQLPRLKMITTCSIGTDSIDLHAAEELGITVCNIPGKTAAIVAEHALALLLSTARRVAFQTAEIKSGRWPRIMAVSLRGKTLGVVGTGNIGCEMIRLGTSIGMNVIAWSFHPSKQKAEKLGFRYVELDELLGASDAISLHVKLTEKSRHLIGPAQLAAMKPGALMINTARGEVVDTAALVQSLQSGHLGGAGIDVFDEEPIPQDHALLQCEQAVLTPHSADQNPEGVDLLNAGAVDNVLAFLEGNPTNVVHAG